MSEIKTDFIEKVINIMKNNELTEIMLEDEASSLYIKSGDFAGNISAKPVENNVPLPIEQPKKEEKKIVPIISNMIGVYFSKPSPDDKPFVKVGDRINAGTQVCIIETIKLMNKIVSEVSGIVKEICIDDGKPVEYGQTIMYIEQD